MKYIRLFILILGLIFVGCKQKNVSKASNDNNKDKIQDLIRKTLIWADSQNTIDLLPAIADNHDSLYIGFNFDVLRLNLKKLKETNFFSNEFIDNYNRIILTLDKKIKNKEFDGWLKGEIQPFGFANDFNPWCYCQEIPDNNPWKRVEINIIKLDNAKGELTWKWAKSDWSDNFKYKFMVVKKDGRWEIAYMQGFDYNESIKKD